MTRMNRSTRSQDRTLALGLLVLDALVIGWFTYRVGINGWADSFAPDRIPQAPGLARRYMWFLAGGAVVTGGGLLAAKRRAAGTAQALILGGASAAFAVVAAQ
jgi:hypothetical protein